MLEVKKINTFYGKVQVLWDVSLKVVKKEIVAFIGANGAGKTTLINTISGLLRPASGTIKFVGKNIEGQAPHSIVERGICHIPEGRRLFPDMSVRENLEMGAYLRRAWRHKEETLEHVYELFPVLQERGGAISQDLKWWRTADVGHGSGVDVSAEVVHH